MSMKSYFLFEFRLDESMAEELLPLVTRMKVLHRMVETADIYGWSSESVLSFIDDLAGFN